jgi:hypothetical protein
MASKRQRQDNQGRKRLFENHPHQNVETSTLRFAARRDDPVIDVLLALR